MGFFDFFKTKPTSQAVEQPKENSSEVNVASHLAVLRDDGVRALQMGEVVFAVKCFQSALALQDDLSTLALLAEAQYRLQDYVAVLPSLERLAQEDSGNINVLLLLARTQGALELYTEMESTCDQALALLNDSSEEESWSVTFEYLKAEALFHLRNSSMAVNGLTQVLEGHPEFAAARLLRARIWASLNQWEEALADTQLLVAADFENEACLLLHAEVLAALQRTEEAGLAFSKVLEINPFHQEAVLKWAAFYEEHELWEKALAVYDEALSLQSDFAEAYQKRGMLKLRLNDKVGAADDFNKSAELGPANSVSQDDEFTNAENRMNEKYKNLNPYGF